MPNKLKKLFEVTQLLSYYNASKIEIDNVNNKVWRPYWDSKYNSLYVNSWPAPLRVNEFSPKIYNIVYLQYVMYLHFIYTLFLLYFHFILPTPHTPLAHSPLWPRGGGEIKYNQKSHSSIFFRYICRTDNVSAIQTYHIIQ